MDQWRIFPGDKVQSSQNITLVGEERSRHADLDNFVKSASTKNIIKKHTAGVIWTHTDGGRLISTEDMIQQHGNQYMTSRMEASKKMKRATDRDQNLSRKKFVKISEIAVLKLSVVLAAVVRGHGCPRFGLL